MGKRKTHGEAAGYFKTYPLMDIHFPENKKDELINAMKARAVGPTWIWWQPVPAKEWEDYIFFRWEPSQRHGERTAGMVPACTLIFLTREPGHFRMTNLIHEGPPSYQVSVDQYVRILRDFEERIAGPAAESVNGITSIETHKRTLEDYFGRQAIRLLRYFCKTSNASSRGSHPADEAKWRAFLLQVHRSGVDVDSMVFAKCLKATGWWWKDDIPRLAAQYDFALPLLKQYDELQAIP
jgi:hypothetical protein